MNFGEFAIQKRVIARISGQHRVDLLAERCVMGARTIQVYVALRRVEAACDVEELDEPLVTPGGCHGLGSIPRTRNSERAGGAIMEIS